MPPPPISVSAPMLPSRTLALPSPVRLSSYTEPTRFSIPDSTSPEASPVLVCAPATVRSTVTPPAEPK